MKDFNKLASHFFGFLTKGSYFCWIDKCQEAFEELKEISTTVPMLRGPNWALPFHILTDALEKVLGVALGKAEDEFPYSIYFISKNLSLDELNYRVTKK